MKRLYEGNEVNELRSTFEEKPEADEDAKTPSEREETEAEKIIGQNDQQDNVPAAGESGGSSLN
jgi:hypothetical protein